MTNPSPGSCLGGLGRPGEGTVPIGAALTTTMRRTPVACIAWTMARVPCSATPTSAFDPGPRAEGTASAPSTADSSAAGSAADRSARTTRAAPACSLPGLRTTAVTWWPAATACSRACLPMPPVAAKMVSFICCSCYPVSVNQNVWRAYHMSSISTTEEGSARRRRRLTNAIKESLRELSIQLSLLNHQVGTHVDLRDVDLDCLDLINRYGPLSPSALARRTGLHPATMTGILDRLERSGWVARERDPGDRRAVLIKAQRDRNAELFGLYAGMNTSMDQLCAGYSEAELELVAEFLRRTTSAGHDATEQLAGECPGRRATALASA